MSESVALPSEAPLAPVYEIRGKPPAFAKYTPSELDAKCQAILDECVKEGSPLTATALAIGLDCETETIERYAGVRANPSEIADGRDEETSPAYALYGPVIKRAWRRCERWFESQFPGLTTPTGMIFLAKARLHWRDCDPPGAVQGGGGSSPITLQIVLQGNQSATVHLECKNAGEP